MCRNLAFDVHLYEERKAAVACGAEPDLAQCLFEDAQMFLVELFQDAAHELNRLHIAGRSVDDQVFLGAVVFLDDSPVGILRSCISGEPGLQLSRNAVVFHPCGNLGLDVVERKNFADNRLFGLCLLFFEFIVLADIGFSGSVELASGEGFADSVAHGVTGNAPFGAA